MDMYVHEPVCAEAGQLPGLVLRVLLLVLGLKQKICHSKDHIHYYYLVAVLITPPKNHLKNTNHDQTIMAVVQKSRFM